MAQSGGFIIAPHEEEKEKDEPLAVEDLDIEEGILELDVEGDN